MVLHRMPRFVGASPITLPERPIRKNVGKEPSLYRLVLINKALKTHFMKEYMTQLNSQLSTNSLVSEDPSNSTEEALTSTPHFDDPVKDEASLQPMVQDIVPLRVVVGVPSIPCTARIRIKTPVEAPLSCPIRLENPTEFPVEYNWMASGGGRILVSPSRGSIAPRDSAYFSFSCTPFTPSPIMALRGDLLAVKWSVVGNDEQNSPTARCDIKVKYSN